MAVKIKLKRMGKIRTPQYRIVVADARTKRDGRAIEEIGTYRPKEDPSFIKVDSERAQYWLSVGAQPTEPVVAILKVTGDWQKHKGLPGAEGRLRTAAPKAEKRAGYDAALAEAHGEPASSGGSATTPRRPRKATSAPAAKATEAPATETRATEAPATEAPSADAAATSTSEPTATAEPTTAPATADEA